MILVIGRRGEVKWYVRGACTVSIANLISRKSSNDKRKIEDNLIYFCDVLYNIWICQTNVLEGGLRLKSMLRWYQRVYMYIYIYI